MGSPIVLVGVAELAVAAVLPAAAIWLVLHADEVGERLVAAGRRVGVVPPPQVRSYAPALERLVADLRRLSAALANVPPGTSQIRRRGLQLAYDDVLAAACRALEVPHSLTTLPLGLDRDLERLRVEAAIESAGLRFRSLTR